MEFGKVAMLIATVFVASAALTAVVRSVACRRVGVDRARPVWHARVRADPG